MTNSNSNQRYYSKSIMSRVAKFNQPRSLLQDDRHDFCMSCSLLKIFPIACSCFVFNMLRTLKLFTGLLIPCTSCHVVLGKHPFWWSFYLMVGESLLAIKQYVITMSFLTMFTFFVWVKRKNSLYKTQSSSHYFCYSNNYISLVIWKFLPVRKIQEFVCLRFRKLAIFDDTIMP